MSEPILVALHALLAGGLEATVLRNATLPEVVSADGFANLVDGAPGDPIDVALSPITYSYAHTVPLELALPSPEAMATAPPVCTELRPADAWILPPTPLSLWMMGWPV